MAASAFLCALRDSQGLPFYQEVANAYDGSGLAIIRMASDRIYHFDILLRQLIRPDGRRLIYVECAYGDDGNPSSERRITRKLDRFLAKGYETIPWTVKRHRGQVGYLFTTNRRFRHPAQGEGGMLVREGVREVLGSSVKHIRDDQVERLCLLSRILQVPDWISGYVGSGGYKDGFGRLV